MHTSDFASRNPVKCDSRQDCQICKFALEMDQMGDNASKIRQITVDDVRAGRAVLPLTQKKPWTDLQNKDSVHEKLKRLIRIGQSPNKHKTKGEHTILKKLHTLFSRGDLVIE